MNRIVGKHQPPSFADDENVLAALRRSSLFQGVAADELRAMLGCFRARMEHYAKDERIYRVGDDASAIGIVVEGNVLVGTEDYWGNSNINAYVGVGGLFAEASACMPGSPCITNVTAGSDCTVVMLEVRRIVSTCPSACVFHQHIVRNLLSALARTDLELTRKTHCLTQRTTRDKVLAYLSACAQEKGSSSFDIPFNRQQLADYLSVERSALSSCLGKMQRDGIIAFRKNHFEILQ